MKSLNNTFISEQLFSKKPWALPELILLGLPETKTGIDHNNENNFSDGALS